MESTKGNGKYQRKWKVPKEMESTKGNGKFEMCLKVLSECFQVNLHLHSDKVQILLFERTAGVISIDLSL